MIDIFVHSNISAELRLDKLLTLSFTMSPSSLGTEQAIRAWGLNFQEPSKVIEDEDKQRIEYYFQLILSMGLAELVALQYARVIYYSRGGLFAQAVVPRFQLRILVMQSLLRMVED
ncbi:MAG: hypothetical protein ACI8UG_002326 [Gammaproteobacteria bacterium]